MAESLTAAELAPADLAQALPLLRVTWPELDLPAWQTFATIFCGQDKAEARITVLIDSNGGLCGLLASRIDYPLGAGRVLAIPVFTAVDIANSLTPVRTLFELAEAQMIELNCDSLQIHLANTQRELVKRLSPFGLSHSGALYSVTADAAATQPNA